ncbi:MAG: 6-bladed beta-propeller [Firmicutes bacterium]|nr:6-bladed beta-propeller [Bacillota bacterium]
MNIKDVGKQLKNLGDSIKVSRRQFTVIILSVFLVGFITLGLYTYFLLGYEYAGNRSTTINGLPKYYHPIAGEGDAKLAKPLSVVAFGKYVYVTDSGHGKLTIFTKRGALVRSVKLLKDSDCYPLGITIDDQNRIYISIEVRGFYHIMVVDAFGKFQYLFPGNSKSAAQDNQPVLNRPVGLFYRDGRIYVTDIGDQDVKVFSTEGKLLVKFGRAGTREGEFMYPHGITADENGDIYVADANNSRVQVFDRNGKFKYFFKPNPKEPFIIPRGIAIDSLGRVHVVDLARQKVFVFTKQGKYILSYGSGKGDSALLYPNGIATDPDAGLIYIADRQKDRIAVFSE